MKLLSISAAIFLASSLTSPGGGVINPPAPRNSVPYLVAVKNVAVLTTGAPADVATIAVNLPPGAARFRVVGTAGTASSHFIVTETQVGSPGASSFQAFDTAAGGGQAITGATSPTAGAGNGSAWASNSSLTVFTSNTIYVRQTANSANAATLSFYILIVPLP